MWFPNVYPTIYLPKWNFEYGYPHFNALLLFRRKLERCKQHNAANHPMKWDVIINDVKLFPTVYHGIYCCKCRRYPIRSLVTNPGALELAVYWCRKFMSQYWIFNVVNMSFNTISQMRSISTVSMKYFFLRKSFVKSFDLLYWKEAPNHARWPIQVGESFQDYSWI